MGNMKAFDVVEMKRAPRNMLDLSHECKTSMNMGELVPVCFMECIPGDRFTLGSQAMVRFSPLVAPPMQRFDSRIEYFFVPYRILWENFMKWISSDPTDVGLPAHPTVTLDDTSVFRTKLVNYFGIPNSLQLSIPGYTEETISAFPFAAYQLIVDQYYRDQNLVPSVWDTIKLQDGDNSANANELLKLRYRSWQHDYFTSCLPFAQKGNPVTIGTTNYLDVPVKGLDPANPGPGFYDVGDPSGANVNVAIEGSPDVPNNQLYADTSALDALSITINDLREASSLQRWLEVNARAGTRPNEVIYGHFGVRSSDARLQRPEYIVGVKQGVAISEVLNTSATVDEPQGNMAGHGVSLIDDQNYGNFFCEEWGIIIGIASVMPTTSYMQGIHKMWYKTESPTQYYWPEFANIGEQPVYKGEVYAFNGDSQDIFGYLPAWQEYRFINDIVTGDFQTSLAYWHCGRFFDAPPVLNGEFVTAEDVRQDIFAVTDPDVDKLYVHVRNMVHASRLIPLYGVPSLE